MSSVWNTPPTTHELAATGSVWDHPPTAEEMGAPEAPSELNSAGRGLAQGATFGFADELAGGAEALYDKLKGSDSPFAATYRKHRDESRANFEAAKKENPLSYGAGELAGGLATGIAAAPLTGGASLGSAVALGAGSGALNALGNAKELDAQAAEDAVQQGVVGGALGAGGYGVGKLLSKGVNAATETLAPKVAGKLDEIGVSQGRRAINGGMKSDISDDAVRRTFAEGHAGAWDTVQDIAGKLEGARLSAGKHVEGLVNEATANGAKVDARALAESWMAEAASTRQSTMNSSAPNALENAAKGLLASADAEGKVPLSIAEQIKTSAQSKSNYNPVAPDTELNSAYKGMAHQLREAGENSMAAAAPEQSAQFVPAKQRYGDLAQAAEASAKGAYAADNRSTVGLTAKIAGLTSLATGHPLGAVVAGAKHLADTRGASTAASLAFKASKSLGKLGQVALTDPKRLGRYGSVIASAAQRGNDALTSVHFVLGQSDPGYQQMVSDLEKEPAP